MIMKTIILPSLLLCLSSQLAQAQGDLYIGTGATLYTTGSASIVTLGNAKLTNNGTLTANGGTVVFIGTATNEDSSINGTGTTSFRNLTVDKSANDVQLNQNISLSGNLTLAAGGVELYEGNVDLGTTGSLQSETASNRVWGEGGYLRRVATLNAPTGINLGNLGAELTSTQNLGSTEVRRSHIPATLNSGGVARRYVITPTNNSGLNAKLRFYYWDSELNDNDENTMVLWRSPDNGVSWTAQTNNTRNTSANWVEATGIAAFSLWTAANLGALPIELLSFVGANKGSYNLLEWATASETNNAGFDIERSTDGVRFQKIGFVAGKGTTAQEQRYTFEDATPSERPASVIYYRLKQIDEDGQFEYSKIVSVHNGSKNTRIQVYPTTTRDVIRVVAEGEPVDAVTVVNQMGQVVLTARQVSSVDMSSLPAGMYVVQVQAGQEQLTERVFKQ